MIHLLNNNATHTLQIWVILDELWYSELSEATWDVCVTVNFFRRWCKQMWPCRFSQMCLMCVVGRAIHTPYRKTSEKKTIKMLPAKIYSEVYVSLLLLHEIKGRLWKPSVLVNRKEETTTITQPFRWDWWLMFENGNVKHAWKHCWIIHNVSQMSKSSVFW